MRFKRTIRLGALSGTASASASAAHNQPEFHAQGICHPIHQGQCRVARPRFEIAQRMHRNGRNLGECFLGQSERPPSIAYERTKMRLIHYNELLDTRSH
jgi:hypothetical protein